MCWPELFPNRRRARRPGEDYTFCLCQRQFRPARRRVDQSLGLAPGQAQGGDGEQLIHLQLGGELGPQPPGLAGMGRKFPPRLLDLGLVGAEVTGRRQGFRQVLEDMPVATGRVCAVCASGYCWPGVPRRRCKVVLRVMGSRSG